MTAFSVYIERRSEDASNLSKADAARLTDALAPYSGVVTVGDGEPLWAARLVVDSDSEAQALAHGSLAILEAATRLGVPASTAVRTEVEPADRPSRMP